MHRGGGRARAEHVPAKGAARAVHHAQDVRVRAHGRVHHAVQQDELVQRGDGDRPAAPARVSSARAGCHGDARGAHPQTRRVTPQQLHAASHEHCYRGATCFAPES